MAAAPSTLVYSASFTLQYHDSASVDAGKDGLLHISEIDWKRLETVEAAGIKEDDKLQVKLLDIDPKTGKFKLSRRVLLEKPEGYVERERRPRPERGERRERRPRPDQNKTEE